MSAVLASRDEIDPDLETELLEAIVDAETDSAGDSDEAMRAIDAALTAAIGRGAGNAQGEDATAATDETMDGDGHNQEGEA